MIQSVLAAGMTTALMMSGTAAAADYRLDRLTPTSPFHGIHGIRFDRSGALYGVSVMGQSLYRIDVARGAATTVVGPPLGGGDDLAFGPDGGLYWTSIFDGSVHVKRPGEAAKVLVRLPSPNAISFNRDGSRLYVSQVFGADAVWEVDPAGVKPNRKIAENVGGLNAFEVGDDGMIYGPVQFQRRYVRIDPDSGAVATVADGFQRPVSSKLDFKGGAYVADLGQIYHIDLKTGSKRPLAKVPAPQDNIALDKDGRHLLVSIASWNSIWSVDVETGALREVIPRAALTAPAGLALATEGAGVRLYVADIWSIRSFTDAAPAPTEFTAPVMSTHVSMAGDRLVVVNEGAGEVALYNRADGKKLSAFTGFAPYTIADAVEAPGGGLLVADRAGGRLLRVSASGAANQTVVAQGLSGPNGLLLSGGSVFVSETDGGAVSRIDLATGRRTVVVDTLDRPEGLALTGSGRLIVVEAGARRILSVDPASGRRETLAAHLPIGERFGVGAFRGVAVQGEVIYFSSDRDNAIYRLTRR